MHKPRRPSAEILAANLQRLLDIGGPRGLPDSQAELGRRAHVAQKTISNWLDPARGVAPQIDKLEAVAHVYGLEVWELLMPDIPDELLLGGGRLARPVEHYG